MKVAEYAKQMGLTRAGVYYQIHHNLVPYYTKSGHYYIDETELDWFGMELKSNDHMVEALMKLFGFTNQEMGHNDKA